MENERREGGQEPMPGRELTGRYTEGEAADSREQPEAEMLAGWEQPEAPGGEVSEEEVSDEEEIDDRDPITVAKENLYDRLPFTYRQVDIFCKVIIGVLVAIFVYYAVT